ncbi:MAG TPA: OPT family oligopeptide transporter [Polyangiaceae bacterium]
MSDALEAPPAPGDGARKPEGAPEFTLRAVACGMGVAALIGSSYPYVVMKLGFGPNISVVSALFGFLALGLWAKNYNRWENNIVQTAGTCAGMTAFLCVVMAAFDMLHADPALHFDLVLSPFDSFLWLTTAGVLGVLLAVPMRRHFVVEEKLAFPDGVAAAETLIVLDSRGAEAKSAARAMALGTGSSAALMLVREDARLLGNVWYRLPEMLALGPLGAPMAVGISWSLLSFGSGMLVGFRVNASMFAGALLAWVLLPEHLLGASLIPELTRRQVLLWVMWPATGMLVAGGLTALALRWRMLKKTFQDLSGAAVAPDDFPMRWVVAGTLVTAAALVLVQRLVLGIPIWMTLVAIVLSVPLMLVGLRVLGETNWGPISALSNMMQAVFGLLAPGHVAANMVASGVTGSVAAESEGLMQDYKTGAIIGSSPKYLTYAQLLAVPVGAASVSLVYPLLRDTYGIGGEHGLSSPISQKWAGFAKLLSRGLDALPNGALAALVIGVVTGVVLTVLENTRARPFVPSPTGVGIGMLVPASAIFTMFLGGVAELVWRRTRPRSAQRHLLPLASGFIAGEAVIAVVIPMLVAAHLLELK